MTDNLAVENASPVTIPYFYEKTFKNFPEELALSWKETKEDHWEKLTYAGYKKLIYDVSKSFVKVCMLCVSMYSSSMVCSSMVHSNNIQIFIMA